jgi:FkbM family methyltransferase
MTMHFPDRLVWANQILEVFGMDCYGVRDLPLACSVVDCGANIGTFVRFVKWMRPEATVLAIEPSLRNLEYLKRNVETLPMGGVSIVHAAVGRESGKTNIGGSTSDGLRVGVKEGQHVAVIPLRDVIAEDVDLLKLDVEGSEIEALEGAGDALKRVRRVVCEYHLYRNRRGSLSSLIGLLEDGGFTFFRTSREVVFEPPDEALPFYCCLVEARRF